MDFVGASLPLSESGLQRSIDLLGAVAAEIWALLSVEARGCGFLKDRHPLRVVNRSAMALESVYRQRQRRLNRVVRSDNDVSEPYQTSRKGPWSCKSHRGSSRRDRCCSEVMSAAQSRGWAYWAPRWVVRQPEYPFCFHICCAITRINCQVRRDNCSVTGNHCFVAVIVLQSRKATVQSREFSV